MSVLDIAVKMEEIEKRVDHLETVDTSDRFDVLSDDVRKLSWRVDHLEKSRNRDVEDQIEDIIHVVARRVRDLSEREKTTMHSMLWRLVDTVRGK